ncbi:class I SAM-dependent methyltransferase [Sphaerisporangium sp. TRM90804]|uniref:class I SAM-dependent methyltransferase n=1 Tax=Sphaerisporangium sp. TRM90804 TaxID=3031113 RepID=UPI00244A45AE|nr:class I SAM-dependent methyltransferase [Sphaerisporangium sp. TRM90804]MDH2428914.1 class I SAM-dependent methyltransferase [Sphaerisporangium sp. TRM90804]
MTTTRTFDDLVAEAASAPVDGWDFSWLDGRATEQRPSWGYARLAAGRMAHATAALDIETGGGEVLAGLPALAPLTVATEAWPPNVAHATAMLRPRGVAVVDTGGEPRLPFGDAAFDLVISRHPVATWWQEIARVLQPGGTYLSQQVGPRSVAGLGELFTGPWPPGADRTPERAREAAEAAGLEVLDLRTESLRTTFDDIGAVVYYLRKIVWLVPGFTVTRHRPQLEALHARIQAEGPFVTHATRYLIEARKPTGITE